MEQRKWLNLLLVFLILSAIGATVWSYFTQCDASACPTVAEFIAEFGIWAPVVFGILYIVSSPVPFLAPVLSAIGGALFGPVRGTVYTIIVATISALVPFMLARRLGREWVESKLKGRRLDEIYQQTSGSQGFWFVLLMRAIPLLPWEMQNYVAGLTKIPVPPFILGTMLGIIPGTFSLVYLGAAVADPTPLELGIAIGLKVATALVPLVAIAIRNRRNRRKESAQ